jgi:hypothetical protein
MAWTRRLSRSTWWPGHDRVPAVPLHPPGAHPGPPPSTIWAAPIRSCGPSGPPEVPGIRRFPPWLHHASRPFSSCASFARGWRGAFPRPVGLTSVKARPEPNTDHLIRQDIVKHVPEIQEDAMHQTPKSQLPRKDAIDSTSPYCHLHLQALLVDGQEVLTDPEGYILNMDEWSEGFARAQAEKEGLTLTDEHWQVIHFIRDLLRGPQRPGTGTRHGHAFPRRPGVQRKATAAICTTSSRWAAHKNRATALPAYARPRANTEVRLPAWPIPRSTRARRDMNIPAPGQETAAARRPEEEAPPLTRRFAALRVVRPPARPGHGGHRGGHPGPGMPARHLAVAAGRPQPTGVVHRARTGVHLAPGAGGGGPNLRPLWPRRFHGAPRGLGRHALPHRRPGPQQSPHRPLPGKPRRWSAAPNDCPSCPGR